MSRRPQNLYTGQAGEHLVSAFLLMEGWNPSIPPVDSGIDVIAHRITDSGDSILALFQVKTTRRNAYNLSLPIEKFNQMLEDAVNLIVVFWASPEHPQTIVFPPRLLHMMTSGGFEDPNAPIRIVGDNYTLKIFRRNDRFFVRNLRNEYTFMLNRYDLIEEYDIDIAHLPEYAEWSPGERTLIEFFMDD